VHSALATAPVARHNDDKNCSDNGDNCDEQQQHHHLIDYCRSWAWQHLLLNRRLAAKRRRATTTTTTAAATGTPANDHDEDDDDADHILLLEHKPVYTLGRGANEEFIIFLQEENTRNTNNDDETTTRELQNLAKRKLRERLSRSNRGPGSARLSIDKHSVLLMEQDLLLNQQQQQQHQYDLDQAIVDRLSSTANHPVWVPNGAPLYRVERGGEVTFHGPSILCVYPIVNLERPPYRPDLHWFLRQMEEVIIQTLQHYGIHGACRDPIHTGVWIQEEDGHDDDAKTTTSASEKNSNKKVAAVGVTASRWITTHGFAINIDPDLSWFDTSIILPCGIPGRGVTSMGEILRKKQQQQQQQQQLTQHHSYPPLHHPHQHQHQHSSNSAIVVPTTRDVASVVVQKMQSVFDIDHVVPGYNLY
jgi:lipoyl(octanoyl) transferase